MTAPAAPPGAMPRQRRRMGGLLWQRDFRLFLAGETVSLVGDAAARVAMPLLAVLVLHAGTFAVAFLTATGYLPWLLIGLPAGAWADRLSCRPLMIACDLAAALLYGSLPAAAWLGMLTIGQLLAVALLAGAAGVLFSTAYQVYLTSLVDAADLVEGNAKLQGSASAAAIAGPGIAGLLAGTAGAAAALLVNAASFVVSAACLSRIRAEPRAAAARGARAGMPREIAEGIRYVARDPYLRPLTIWAASVNLGLTGYGALLVVFLIRVAGLGAGATGLLLAVSGAGGLVGALLAGRLSRHLGSARALLLCALGAMPFSMIIPLTGPGPRLAYFIAGMLITGGGVVAGSIILVSFRQAYCPPPLLGRVTATMRFLLVGTNPVGALAAGGIGTWLGVREALWVMLGIATASGAMLLTRAFLGIRELPARR